MALPEYPRIVWQNLVWASGTTLTASSELAGWEALNLRAQNRYPGWRSASGMGTETLTIEFASTAISVIGIVDVALPTGGTVAAEYWTGSSWAAFTAATPSLFTFPAFNPSSVSILWYPATRVTTKVRLTFANPLGAMTTMRLGAVFVGAYYQLPLGIMPGSSVDWVDPSQVTETEGGQQHAWVRRKYRNVNTQAPACPPATAATLQQIVDTVGATTPVLYAVDPLTLTRCYMGYLSATVSDAHNGSDRRDIGLALKEAR